LIQSKAEYTSQQSHLALVGSRPDGRDILSGYFQNLLDAEKRALLLATAKAWLLGTPQKKRKSEASLHKQRVLSSNTTPVEI
jgi:hypothetical protein